MDEQTTIPTAAPAGSAEKIEVLRERVRLLSRLPENSRPSIFSIDDSLHRVDQRFDPEPPIGL